MNCNICNKVPATVHVIRIQNNKVIEVHYCAQCNLLKSNFNQENSKLSILGDIYNQLMNTENLNADIPSDNSTRNKACLVCGLTYEKFKEIGKLGCPDCFQTFKDTLVYLLRRMHGSIQHIGKNPAQVSDLVFRNKQILELRQQLLYAIKSEDYEQAAKLRDLIQQTERN